MRAVCGLRSKHPSPYFRAPLPTYSNNSTTNTTPSHLTLLSNITHWLCIVRRMGMIDSLADWWWWWSSSRYIFPTFREMNYDGDDDGEKIYNERGDDKGWWRQWWTVNIVLLLLIGWTTMKANISGQCSGPVHSNCHLMALPMFFKIGNAPFNMYILPF